MNRTWMSVVGVATAVTTTAAAWAPVTAAAPTLDMNDNAQSQRAGEATDGTYESCAAYFGFGKFDGSLDIVEFDVADTNGADGATHTVPSDTQVVLVLTNEAGDQLECAPVEVTETMWNDAMDGLDLTMLGYSPEHPLPSWPGPGHYIYPTVNFDPYIVGSGAEPGTDFGTVTAAGFEVTSIPDGHTLVSPTGVKPLAVHYPGGGEGYTFAADPLLTAYLTATAGADVAAAFSAALVSCADEDTADFDADLIAAVRALEEYRGYSPEDEEWVDCSSVARLNGEASFQLDLSDTVNYVEPIRLSLPPAPTTTSTTTSTSTTSTTTPSTTTAPAVKPQAVAAKPVSATPAYTG